MIKIEHVNVSHASICTVRTSFTGVEHIVHKGTRFALEDFQPKGEIFEFRNYDAFLPLRIDSGLVIKKQPGNKVKVYSYSVHGLGPVEIIPQSAPTNGATNGKRSVGRPKGSTKRTA